MAKKENKKEQNTSSILWKLTFVIPSIIFAVISLYVLSINLYAIYKYKYELSFLILIIPICLFVLTFLLLKISKYKKISTIFKYIYLLLFFCLIFYIGFKTRVGMFNTWDYGQLIRAAFSIVQGETYNRLYFIRYPNNIILLFFETILCKVGKIYNSSITLKGVQSITILVNVIIIFINIIFTSLMAKKINGQKGYIISNILILIFAPFYLYATILYSDTIGMLLNITAFLLYYYLNNVKSSKIKKLLDILLALDIIIGFKFKATNIFIVIAIIIDWISQKEIKDIFKLILLLIIILIPINFAINKWFGLTAEEQEKYQFPYTHWIMMTLNPDKTGGYSEEDVQYTMSFNTIQERKEANISKIKERTKSYGTKELIHRILVTKNIYTWSNPTLGTDDYLGRFPNEKNFINEMVTVKGKNYSKYIKHIRSIYLILLTFMFISVIYNIKDKNKYIFISQLLIVGIFLFELIWECHSRYLYTFLPFMIILATYSIAKVYDSIINLSKEKE